MLSISMQKKPEAKASTAYKNKPAKLHSIWEKAIESIFLICAGIAVLSVITITIYLFISGYPAIKEIGFFNFVFGSVWEPGQSQFGIFPMIVASVYTTVGAVIIGVTIGIFTAIFLAEIAPKWLVRIFKPAIDLLAGIPSIVFGFFGLNIIVPFISDHFGGPGNSLLAVIIILSMMILPTIISITETSLRAVPASYKEGSLALGATHIQTIFKVILPAARSGIMTAVVLGTGRAIGETMAVIMIAGNSALIPESLLQPIRTMTGNIVIELGYAFGLHRQALFATGVILFLFIMVLNIILNFVIRKAGEIYE